MLRNTCLIIFFLFFVIGADAEMVTIEKITGVVKTKEGKPAEYISVCLQGTAYGAVTNEGGAFEFEAPEGTYTLLLKSIQADDKEYPITVSKDSKNHYPYLKIDDGKNQLDEIVVTAQFEPQSLRNSLYKVRVINQKTIQQKAATDMQSLLSNEMGIRVLNDFTLGESNFELMGMSGNNVKVLLDGVPMVDRGSTKQSLSQIDVNNIQQIEIVEGPMSVIYGTDALAGVINIITKKNTASHDKESYSISARLQEESVGDEYKFLDGKGIHNANLSGSWSSKFGLYANGSITRNMLGGWKGDKTGREKLWSPKDQYYYEGLVGFRRNKFNVWYRLNYLNEKIDTPKNPSELTPYQIADQTFKTNRYTHIIQGDWNINDGLDVNVSASLQDYKRKTRTIISDLETGERWLSTDPSSQDNSEYKSAFVRATATWKTNDVLSFQPGLEYNWDKGQGQRIVGQNTINSLAFFLSAEWKPLSFMSLRPGVRTILDSDFDAPFAIPSINTKFAVNSNLDLRFSYAYGFRAPTLQELYFSFHDATHNIDGNPNLKAEYSNNFSGSVTWRWLNSDEVHVFSILSLFYNSFKDKITLAQAIDNSTLTTYYNISRFKTLGGSVENTISWKKLQANVGFSLVGRYNNFKDNEAYKDENLPTFKYSPEVTANVNYFIDRTKTNLSFYYKFTGARHQYSYDTTSGNLYLGNMGSYHTGDFTVSQNIGQYLTLNAGVKNLFNVTTINNTIREEYHDFEGSSSLVGYGRSYFVGLRFLLNK